MKIHTVGHSKHPIEDFISMLKANEIELVADVRRIPRSRFNPQFNTTKLKESLQKEGIEYFWMPELGGKRDPVPGSTNTAWKEAAFQGYADHMQTSEFERGLAQLIIHAKTRNTAYMCAEADYQNCHRKLLSDALTARGLDVFHITKTGLEPHKLTPFARVESKRVTYPSASPELDF
ncbi:MAG TPA: DUF488 domain-containing protein [Acidobacteriota bacterium]|nr:DUF488 domain-containing protein [Acidobacteriota bacterium]